jgi:HSP20 family protein
MMKEKKAKEDANLAIRNEPLPSLWSNWFEPFPAATPFSMMRRFTEDMERFFGDIPMPSMELPRMRKFQKTMWSPEIEVSRTNGELIVTADLPGLKKSDVNVEFTEGALIISGERNQETKKEEEGYFRTERSYGSFYRAIPLPEGFDADKATAKFENGVLYVSVAVPKLETKGRKLEITEGPKVQAKAA